MNTSCFAYSDGVCMALWVGPSGCRNCAFFKTQAQLDAEQQRVYELIAAKPRITQLCIASKYYRGKMPWNPKEERKRYERC